MMKRIFTVLSLAGVMTFSLSADAHCAAKSGHAVARSAKFAAQFSPAKAAKLASFPFRHPVKTLKAVF